MKKIVKTGLILSMCLSMASCDKDNDGAVQTPSRGPLESAMAGNYWKEEIKFIYMERYGDELLLSNEISREGIMEGRPGHSDELYLDIIYVEPETGRVFRYDRKTYNNNTEYEGYHANWYSIEYDEPNRSLRFVSPDQRLMYMNVVAESDLKLIGQTDEILTFEAPIKPYTYGFWDLDNEYYSRRNYVALQVRFLKIKYSDQFENVPQLD